jgi:hypothetical protein
MDNVGLYSETRNEYLKQLSTWITPPLVEFFRTEYARISGEVGARRAMGAFQNFCSEVPRWNQDIIDKHINTVLDNCRCDYVEELMTAIFIAHTKMLTAIRISTKEKKLSIKLPKLDHFLHRVFVECARSFWKAPFLFSEEQPLVERQKNILQAESMCVEALSGAVRSLLPVKNILRDYLDEEDDVPAPSSASESKSKKKKAPVSREPESDSDSSSSSDDEEEDIQVPVLPPIEIPALPAKASDLAKEPTKEPTKAQTEEKVEEKKEEPKPTFVVEKLVTPPPAPVLAESNHEVKAEVKASEVQITKLDTAAPIPVVETAAPVAALDDPPRVMIDTVPMVHFTPFDTVFDENKPGVSEIQYKEKLSVEDKPPSNWGLSDDDDEDIPKLTISGAGESIGLDEIEDLEGPPKPVAPKPAEQEQEKDIDAPLGSTGDFEELF